MGQNKTKVGLKVEFGDLVVKCDDGQNKTKVGLKGF